MESFHLESIEYVNDLGITIDSNLIFHQLTLYTAPGLISKANNMLGNIAKSFGLLNEEMYLRIYPTMVCPILEHRNLIWVPYFRPDQ